MRSHSSWLSHRKKDNFQRKCQFVRGTLNNNNNVEYSVKGLLHGLKQLYFEFRILFSMNFFSYPNPKYSF